VPAGEERVARGGRDRVGDSLARGALPAGGFLELGDRADVSPHDVVGGRRRATLAPRTPGITPAPAAPSASAAFRAGRVTGLRWPADLPLGDAATANSRPAAAALDRERRARSGVRRRPGAGDGDRTSALRPPSRSPVRSGPARFL
jgi:hypothetical protein